MVTFIALYSSLTIRLQKLKFNLRRFEGYTRAYKTDGVDGSYLILYSDTRPIVYADITYRYSGSGGLNKGDRVMLPLAFITKELSDIIIEPFLVSGALDKVSEKSIRFVKGEVVGKAE